MFAKKELSGVIIAGGGRFGRCLADQLNLADEIVTVIDINCELFNTLMPEFSGSTIEGDASSIDVLRLAGINRVRAVISATDDDNVNLMVAQIAKDIYEVPTVIAVVNNSNILSAKEGFDFMILCPALVMTQEVIKYLKTEEG
jgi:trk system potassium uptake protein TrkA